MEVFCFVDQRIDNFGDDLNRWMWKKVMDQPLGEKDGTLLLGIGTILGRNVVPKAERYIVFGSGVGYSAPPEDFGGRRWNILSVRGPLTAKALGLPQHLAVVDGAILLRLLAECDPIPESERSGIVFMPHYESLHTGNWQEVCQLAGFEFLDPPENSEKTVQRIRKSRLVIADAMHAAIVADSLRVPWIPVVTSPQSSTFKWLDWSMSLDLPYKPTRLPPSTSLEFWRTNSFKYYGQQFYLKHATESAALRQYKRINRIESWSLTSPVRTRLVNLTWSIPKKLISSSLLTSRKRSQDQKRTDFAAQALVRAAKLPSYLSDETKFNSKLSHSASLLQDLQNLI